MNFSICCETRLSTLLSISRRAYHPTTTTRPFTCLMKNFAKENERTGVAFRNREAKHGPLTEKVVSEVRWWTPRGKKERFNAVLCRVFGTTLKLWQSRKHAERRAAPVGVCIPFPPLGIPSQFRSSAGEGSNDATEF